MQLRVVIVIVPAVAAGVMATMLPLTSSLSLAPSGFLTIFHEGSRSHGGSGHRAEDEDAGFNLALCGLAGGTVFGSSCDRINILVPAARAGLRIMSMPLPLPTIMVLSGTRRRCGSSSVTRGGPGIVIVVRPGR